ncbi:hypothetical protein A2335_00965 [Candidatus Peregrinibacteria bacterium RIFOXYB2_FULL_32_7]|nr:MAG: hypothetical protein A2335_00965 [Candidatus Peregrinibacteria bacterium RIFOXYB2_FULL_32_7]
MHCRCPFAKYHLPLARIFISAIFIIGGIHKITDFTATKLAMEGNGVPLTTAILILAIVIEIGLGLMILIGYKIRCVAMTLAIYLMIVTLVMHLDLSDPGQKVHVLKNLAIIGGLLALESAGAGCCSLEEK